MEKRLLKQKSLFDDEDLEKEPRAKAMRETLCWLGYDYLASGRRDLFVKHQKHCKLCQRHYLRPE